MAATSGAPSTWIVIGASRGIGLEFTRQLLDDSQPVPAFSGAASTISASQSRQVIAVVRNPENANELWQIAAGQKRPGRCLIEQCDVRIEGEIEAFISRIQRLVNGGLHIEGVILNAGILQYPNRATEISFEDFAAHLHTNTIGPVIIAQKLINISSSASTGSIYSGSTSAMFVPRPPAKVVFISSDSGSTTRFLEYEDGFAAYSASKAALNQMLRHMAAELKRKGGVWSDVCVLALHPGEVATDMANVNLDWEVEGIIQAQESVTGMMKVIASKTSKDSGTFWCWDGREHPW